MARINIDVPGIGIVEVEGAASEDTLLKILEATKKSEVTKKKEEQQATKAAKNASKAFDDAAESAEGMADALDDSIEQQKKNNIGLEAARKNLQQSFKNLGVTAVAVGAKLLSGAEEMANNPIAATRDIINTGIDVIADFAGGLASAIPVVGGFIKGMSEAVAELFKMANNMFADQLQKSVDALQSFNKSGVSFAGGMTEMANIAHSAGLGIKDFSTIVSKSKDQLNLLGLSGGEAAVRLGKAMGEAATLTGKSGQSLRSEMFKMGYTYEEQGELFVGFMASMNTAGKLRSMNETQIAEGTRTYARDLKVLSDITGKNAKQAQEEAQKASLLADIQARLSPEELEKFQAAYRSMPESAQKGFLEFVSSGGKVIADQSTNIAMAQNQEIRKLFTQSYGDIKNASLGASEVQQRTLEQSIIAGQAQQKLNKQNGAAINTAARFTGQFQGAADMINQFTVMGTKNVESLTKSAADAEAQATATDKLSTGTAELYNTTKEFQVLLEQTINTELDTYAGLLVQVNAGTIELIKTLKDKLSGDAEDKNSAYDTDMFGFKKLKQKPVTFPYADKAPKAPVSANQTIDLGATLKDYLTPKPGDSNYRQRSTTALPELAEGGVITGPTSGYRAVLHGNEAVVPLPDGKSIPVKMQEQQAGTTAYSGPTAGMQEIVAEIKNGHNMTLGAMQQMISALNKNNTLTSGILQHTI